MAPDRFVVRTAPHPVGVVARAGFPLDHPYLEHCALPILGPSAVALLRKAHRLTQVRNPARLPFDELAAGLGINGDSLRYAIRRVQRYQFAATDAWWRLTVFDRYPPLSQRLLEKLPASARAAHDRLLDEHLRTLGRPDPATDQVKATARFTARLDSVQRQSLSVPDLGR